MTVSRGRRRPRPRLRYFGRGSAGRPGRGEPQLEVLAQILDVLEAHRAAQQPRGDAARLERGRVQLAVSGGGRVAS